MPWSAQPFDEGELELEAMQVEELQRAERLLVRRLADPLFEEAIEKPPHLFRAELARVALFMEGDEAARPAEVGALCPHAVVPSSQLEEQLVEEIRFGRFILRTRHSPESANVPRQFPKFSPRAARAGGGRLPGGCGGRFG